MRKLSIAASLAMATLLLGYTTHSFGLDDNQAKVQVTENNQDSLDDVIRNLETVRKTLEKTDHASDPELTEALEKIDQSLVTLKKKNTTVEREELIVHDDAFQDPFSLQLQDPFSTSGSGWDPFAQMRRMQAIQEQMMMQAFGPSGPIGGGFSSNMNRGANVYSPNIDMTENDDNYVVRVDIPGVDKSNIDVDVKDNTVRISGERNETVEKNSGNGSYHQRERRVGRFTRSMTLPGPVDSDKAEAKYEDGVLKITIPKQQAEKRFGRVIVK